MQTFLQYLFHYWWVIFIFAGSITAGLKSIGAANERRATRRQERYRLKQQVRLAAVQGSAGRKADLQAQRRALTKIIDEHNQTDARWLSYEIDLVKLLETPLMTDMREPLTVAFHKAKRQADFLRPADESASLDSETQKDYRDAVHDYATAFDVAEAEAQRRKLSAYSEAEQDRLQRAQRMIKLASNESAAPPERQNAYARARAELEGLLVLPSASTAAIERSIAGEIEA
ncbi:MAG: hypothetical protein ABI137_07070 [Antricoccus sp.]